MFHKVKNVFVLPDYKLSVQFSEGVTKLYLSLIHISFPASAVAKGITH